MTSCLWTSSNHSSNWDVVFGKVQRHQDSIGEYGGRRDSRRQCCSDSVRSPDQEFRRLKMTSSIPPTILLPTCLLPPNRSPRAQTDSIDQRTSNRMENRLFRIISFKLDARESSLALGLLSRLTNAGRRIEGALIAIP